MTNKEVLRLKLVRRSKVDELAAMLEMQGRRLRELEAKLQQEKEAKANLESDFQHLLDQLQLIGPHFGMDKEPAVLCG